MYKYKSLQEVQLPQEHLSFLQNFIITNYLKQEVDVELNVCAYKRSPCGLPIAGNMSRDQKTMTLLTPIEKCTIIHGVAFTA